MSKPNEGVMRFVITHINKDGMRGLTFAKQGRYTYDTREKATEFMDACKEQGGLLRVIGEEAMKTLEVREAECWPGEPGEPGDPKGSWFDVEDLLEELVAKHMKKPKQTKAIVTKQTKAIAAKRVRDEVRVYRNSLLHVFNDLDGVKAEEVEEDAILIKETNGDEYVLRVSKP